VGIPAAVRFASSFVMIMMIQIRDDTRTGKPYLDIRVMKWFTFGVLLHEWSIKLRVLPFLFFLFFCVHVNRVPRISCSMML
jgi:hypothetical protein